MSAFREKMMFDQDSVYKSDDPNIRVIRAILFKMNITHGIFLDRYVKSLREAEESLPRSKAIQQAVADRILLYGVKPIKQEKVNKILANLGYVISDFAFGDTESHVAIVDTADGSSHLFSSENSIKSEETSHA